MSDATRAVHAAFETVVDAEAALDRLAAAGVAAADVEVRSSIPHHGLVPAGARVRSRVPWMAVLGGALGGTAAFLLVSLTSQAYPLPTGGMPIVPLPPGGVITFEGVAIGAILFTVATVLAECGLPALRSPPGPLDAHVAAGRIVVSVRDPAVAPETWARSALALEVEALPG